MNMFERFYKYIDVKDKDDCWEWIGLKNKDGYGRFRLTDKMVLAHRWMWEMEDSDIPEGLMVLHKCNNRGCVNPNHLYLGTNQDNMNDMSIAGSKKGNRNAMSKLTEDDVREIRRLISEGYIQGYIAGIFGVNHATISDINRRYRWGWLDENK